MLIPLAMLMAVDRQYRTGIMSLSFVPDRAKVHSTGQNKYGDIILSGDI